MTGLVETGRNVEAFGQLRAAHAAAADGMKSDATADHDGSVYALQIMEAASAEAVHWLDTMEPFFNEHLARPQASPSDRNEVDFF